MASDPTLEDPVADQRRNVQKLAKILTEILKTDPYGDRPTVALVLAQALQTIEYGRHTQRELTSIAISEGKDPECDFEIIAARGDQPLEVRIPFAREWLNNEYAETTSVCVSPPPLDTGGTRGFLGL